MRETRADTRIAFVGALALHALLFALLFAGMWWTRTAAPVSAAGPQIEADLVDPNALAAPLRRALDAPAQREPEPPPQPEQSAPPPQPLPEPRPEDSQVAPQPDAQAPVPEPDTREQERVEREAEAARRAEREQEEKRRQEQIDLTERKRQEEAEKKQRLARQAAQQAKQQEIARQLEKIRAEREKAKKAADLAEQKLRQLADATAKASQPSASSAAPPPGNDGADAGLLARYKAALNAAIVQNWTRPDTVPLGQTCRISIRQVAGGTVIKAQVDPSCPYDELGRRSIEAAVLKAQPLPYAGFESVFRRDLLLTFEARDR